ncbi:MAG: sugar-binding domain-containing protein [Verrucomicrobiia bacterium]|jgi:hypothetical protein
MKFVLNPLAIAILAASVSLAVGAQPSAPVGRPKHFARVNPVLPSPVRSLLSLDGEWEFKMDPTDVGKAADWHTSQTPFPDKIKVPGCWEAQGFGGPAERIGYEKETVRLRGSYQGPAWFRKTVSVPKAWSGRRVWLNFGGVHPSADVWCNGVYLGAHDVYFEPFGFDVSDLVKPGGHATVLVRIDNRKRVTLGCINYMWQWGGIHRSVVLEATAAVSIGGAVIRPDLDRSIVEVEVELENAGPLPAELHIDAEARLMGSGAADSSGCCMEKVTGQKVALKLPVGNVRAWSPESPRLYRLDLRLSRGKELLDTWSERFGFCKREVRGNAVFINNQQVFLRAYGNDCIYPMTVAPPASREEELWRFTRAREFGFNYVRNHTWIPLPEYFDAADEAGIMVQPELPFGPTPERLRAMIRNYRNHPSLATYSMTNESMFGGKPLSELYHLAKALDPARFAIDSDGCRGPLRDTADLWVAADAGPNLVEALQRKPVIHHEFLNAPTIPDPALLPRFTGAFQPVAMERLAAWAKTKGLEAEVRESVRASRYFQKLRQKEAIENARRNQRGLAGYCYWTITDFWEYGQGLFDMMWQPKAWTAGEFRRFNDAAAVLAAMPNTVAWQGSRLPEKLSVSNYTGLNIRNASLQWRLTAGQEILAKGALPDVTALAGDVTDVGEVEIVLPELRRNAKLTFACELKQGALHLENEWEIWSFSRAALAGSLPGGVRFRGDAAKLARRYPATAANADDDLLVADKIELADLDFLQRGGRVLLISPASFLSDRRQLATGWWAPARDSQLGLAMRQHPALESFPNDGAAGAQIRRLLESAVNLDAFPFPVTPIIYGLSHPLHEPCHLRSCLFELPVGRGMLLVSGLNLMSAVPESTALLDCLLRYASGLRFQSKGDAGSAALEAFTPATAKLSVTKRAGEAKVRPGDAVPVEIRVRNNSFMPSEVRVTDTVPAGVETVETLEWMVALRAQEERIISYMIRPARAGEFTLPAATLVFGNDRKQSEPATVIAVVAAPSAFSRIASPPAKDIVAAWPCDEDKGGVARDESGKHPLVLEDVAWSYGPSGGALKFNGRTSRASVAAASDLNLHMPFTVSLWFWPNDLEKDSPQSLIHRGAPDSSSYSIYLNGTTLHFVVTANGNKHNYPVRDACPQPRTWYHVACSYDGHSVGLFVNGKLKRRVPAQHGNPEPSETPLFVGCRGKQNDWPFEGLIDQLTILRSADVSEETTK